MTLGGKFQSGDNIWKDKKFCKMRDSIGRSGVTRLWIQKKKVLLTYILIIVHTEVITLKKGTGVPENYVF